MSGRMESVEKEKAPYRTRLKNRPGFGTRGMRWIYRALYPFFHCRVRRTQELREHGEPVVYIANHYNVFGPISFVLSVPEAWHIWMNEDLIEPESAAENLQPGMKKLLPFLNGKQNAWLCRKIAAFIVYVMRQFGVIPVNRQQPSKLITTMRKSISALEEGHSLLIFPETGLPEYSLTSVTPFFSGFAMLGRLYYRKTGKILYFCPCYIDEQHHQIRMGALVGYQPDADSGEETERVSEELNRRIREMAAENRGLEKEPGTPVRRTILFFCNLVRLLLLVPLGVMLGLPNPRMILLFYVLSEGLRILFNAVCSTYTSSNRLSFLFSHGLGILTDIGVLAYLTAGLPELRWLLYTTMLNGAVILCSNIVTHARYRRFAGVNYFDTLSANLIFLICLQQMLQIQLAPLVLGVLVLGTMVFLCFSAGFTLAFNARIGREEGLRDTEG